MQHFYNTLQLDFPEVQIEEEKAKTGDEIVLNIFKLNPYAELTPREVWAMTISQGHDYELTSVRRSINTLTKAGKLEKMGKEKQKVESKGVVNFTWRLK